MLKETLDFGFRSAGDNDFEPRSICGRISQPLQEDWTVSVVTTFIECVNDKDESVLWVARKVTDEVKEERILHRP